MEETMNKVLAVIPAFNEELNIEMVVKELTMCCPQIDYVVVNDGSTDRTVRICRDLGFNLIDLPVNLGLAGCFQTGMKYAYQKGYDYAIQFDGDGQHKPEFIASMKEKLFHEDDWKQNDNRSNSADHRNLPYRPYIRDADV